MKKNNIYLLYPFATKTDMMGAFKNRSATEKFTITEKGFINKPLVDQPH